MEQRPTGKFAPLTPWEYFGLTLLFCVPIVGLVFLVFFSVSKKNENRRTYARACCLMMAFLAIIIGILFLTGVATDVLEKLGFIKTYSWR